MKENREKKLVLEHKKYISRLFNIYVTNQWIYTVLLMNVAPVYSFPIKRCLETFRFTMKKIHKFNILVISFYFEMLTKEPNLMCPVSQALLSI